MNLNNLLQETYWFSQPRTLYGVERWWWWAGFGVLVMAGIMLFALRQSQAETYQKTLFARFGALGMTMGILGALWFWLRQERVLFLGWRFWLLAWALAFVVWFSRIVRYAVKRVPALREEQREREMRKKYLPGRS